MPSTWMILWSPKEIRSAHADGVLQVLGSNHFGRRGVARGDTVWVVYSPSRGKLHTIGALTIADPVNRKGAVKRFGADLFARQWFVRPLKGRGTPVREVDISTVARKLSFVNSRKGSERLRFGTNAPALGHQLRMMRELTPQSATQLARVDASRAPVDVGPRTDFVAASAALAVGDTRREVLVRKEQGALRKLLFRDRSTALCALCGEELPVTLLVAGH